MICSSCDDGGLEKGLSSVVCDELQDVKSMENVNDRRKGNKRTPVC